MNNTPFKIMTIFGTRPEAIKMAPLIRLLNQEPAIESVVTTTAQHRQQLDQVLKAFDLQPRYDLNIMKAGQSLTDINTNILQALDPVLKETAPDLVLVHGDASTSFVSALCAYYNKIPVGHVEAGLRSHDKYQPFPEEINRKLLSSLADLHFAPTEVSKDNLVKENIIKNVFVTGNTVIDAMAHTIKPGYVFKEKALNNLQGRIITLTAHRRENLGQPLENICRAVLKLRDKYEDLIFVYPVHLNPQVRHKVIDLLRNKERIILTDPLDIIEMHNLMAKSRLILTDSGGLQEEAPHLNVPVLVLRNVTERPEGIEANVTRLCGTDADHIVELTSLLLDNEEEYQKMARGKNPFGDGTASMRIVKAIKNFYMTI